jgi:hypothetical protein
MLADALIAAVILLLVAGIVRRPLFDDLQPYSNAEGEPTASVDITHDSDDWCAARPWNTRDDTWIEVDDIHTDPAYSNLPGNIFHHNDYSGLRD